MTMPTQTNNENEDNFKAGSQNTQTPSIETETIKQRRFLEKFLKRSTHGPSEDEIYPFF
jgi:hypothetical protein